MGTERQSTAVIFAGGDAPVSGSLTDLVSGALIVAADSGLRHALAAGLAVDVVVGDLDSVDPTDLEAAVGAGSTVERHPVDKDATDLELALTAARVRGARRIVVVGAGGGRLDHFLANTLLFASPDFADLEIEARIGDAIASVVRTVIELRGTPGSLVSLLPLGGPACGITTHGLRWPLDHEDLLPGSTRGVSNEIDEPVARVSLADGVLLVVRPGLVDLDPTHPPTTRTH